MRELTKLTAFILLIIGTLGLIVNEFIFNWASIVTLTFAAVNIVGFAVLAYVFWGRKKEI
jgi:hypothetical protein